MVCLTLPSVGAARSRPLVTNNHPKVLFTRSELGTILTRIQSGGVFDKEFTEFAQDMTFIDSDFLPYYPGSSRIKDLDDLVPGELIPVLHYILDKVMKNAFLYQVADGTDGGSSANIKTPSYSSKNEYMTNIFPDLQWLCMIVRDTRFQKKSRESQNLAIKALAIAYDWADSHFTSATNPTKGDMEAALRCLGDYHLKGGTWYGTAFENHGPWDSKMMAYIAASLGDDEYLESDYFTEETNSLGGTAVVYKSAYTYLQQILQAVDWAAGPRGGWPEGIGYFQSKELPELLEYAEVVSTYKSYLTTEIFDNNLFVHAGEMLFTMTTPDGMYMKFSDTGQKTALPSEHSHYGTDGYSYGDINNIGAGYIAGYHLYRLYHRLRAAGYPGEAEIALAYANEYCFDFPSGVPLQEKKINWLYKFIWQTGNEPDLKIADAVKSGLLSSARYYDRAGVLLTRQEIHNQSVGTVVRFDGSPYYLNGHQHLAAGNFTIFKNGNLAIDGGRYITVKDYYYEDGYRSSICHNVVMFGEDADKGQRTIRTKGMRAPIVYEQRYGYDDYVTGEENVSINCYQYEAPFDYVYKYRAMKLDLAKVYSTGDLDVDAYTRYLVHLTRRDHGHPERPDFVIVYDDISLGIQDYATWQMHYREDPLGTVRSLLAHGDPSAFQIDRFLPASDTDGILKPSYQLPAAGFEYNGRLFVKCLSPNEITLSHEDLSSIAFDKTHNLEPPSGSFNGRVWEEDTHILRFQSRTPEWEHEFLTVLYPSTTYDDLEAYSDDIYTILENDNARFVMIRKGARPIPHLSRNIAVGFVRSNPEEEIKYTLKDLDSGYTSHYILGLAPGRYRVWVNGTGKATFDTRLSYPDKSWGVLVMETNGTNDRVTIRYIGP